MTPNNRFKHRFNGAVFPRQLPDRCISDADPRLPRRLQGQVQDLGGQLDAGN